MPHQTLENGLRLDRTAKLVGVDHKPVTVEQMELTRLRAENARLKMERDKLKKPLSIQEVNATEFDIIPAGVL